MKRIKDMGIDFGQGYYYAKPMPLSEIDNFIL